MAIAIYRGRHPEPSFSIPIPRDNQRVSFSPGWGTYVWNDHNESVSLPPDVPRRIHRWAAIVAAALRRRTGPWFTIRLEKGEWERCVEEVGRPFKVREVLKIFGNQPETIKNFLEVEVKPYSWGSMAGWFKYDPIYGVQKTDIYGKPIDG